MNAAPARESTIGALLAGAAARLAGTGADRLDAELLLGVVLDVDRAHLYAHPEASVPAAATTDFLRLVARRAEGYPAAYLTGRREFWSLELVVNQHTLIPRPETELLVEITLGLLRQHVAPALLELGTGSGAVGIALARERTDAHVTATDLCRHALALAADNAARHALDNIRFVHSDWFGALGTERFAVIVSNPPYVDEHDPALWQAPLRHEPRLALDGGRAGLAALTRISAGAGRHLEPGAALVLEHGHDQGAAVRELLRVRGFTDVYTLRDGAGLERVSVGTWV